MSRSRKPNRYRAADDLLALTNVETPLKGGLNTPLHTTDFSAHAGKGVIATPNTVLSAVAATPRSVVGGDTPGSMVSATPGATPFRDQLNINQDLSAHQSLDRDALRKQLGSLPKPKNDFEIVLPEEESVEEEPTEEWEVDAAELDERRQQLLAKKREAEMKKRSQPMQRALPIPSKLNESYKKRSQAPTELGKADDIIKAEMYALMEWDVDGKKPADVFSPAAMQAARELILSESAAGEELDANMWQVISNCTSELIRYQDRFTRLNNLNKKEQIEALSDMFKIHYNWMAQQAKKASKMEKKLKTKLHGYQVREHDLSAKIKAVREEQENQLIQLKTFSRMEENEQKAIVKRVNTLVGELKQQEEREKALQKRYAALQHRKWELEQAELRERATTSAAPTRYEAQQQEATAQQ
ncbi:hypothetical protein AAVH_10144 [Aphelenchoides avenae]|nr:hypothetical protein AAVH_10144 [Aphelenchus avenae]